MGVDTKAILTKGTTAEQIAKSLSDKYSEVSVESTKMEDFIFISFTDGEDKRRLAVSFSNSCERDYGIAGVWTSLGLWGNSIEIAKYLCETFGGYIDENDCDEHDFYPINIEKYLAGNATTETDSFKQRLYTN